ncbi:MFS transporter [Brevibacillus composti]|uniref:MFS transporter n=1 Tax=Brevibacillus composti TaxID=2796470 RepID=A0A7T5JMD1_9BACL|nr:MFS transporter [Brevibacillus composti]QQE72977.1 MFS transporter [Brevibacillus composti]QUO40055.1 MFS transporter [Brevibacillus composti]
MRFLLFVILFLVSFDMHAQTPLLAPYMHVLGASTAMIGFVLGAYGVSNMTGNLIAGPFLDRFPKKWFIVSALILSGFILAGQGIVRETESFFVLRLLLGFLMAFVSPACFALLGETGRTRAEQGELMAKNGMVLTAAAVVSPAVGSFLGVQFGYGMSFVILGGIMGGAGLFALLVLPRGPAVERAERETGDAAKKGFGKGAGLRELSRAPSLTDILENRHLYLAYLGGFAVMYAQGTIIYEIPLSIQKENLPLSVTGMLFSLKGLGSMAILSQFWLARIGPEERTLAGLGMLSILMYLMALGTPLSLYIMMFLLGCCTGLLFPALSTILTVHAPRELYGSAFSIFSAVLSAGAILAPVVSGLISNWNHSFFIVFFVTAGSLLFGSFHRLFLNRPIG